MMGIMNLSGLLVLVVSIAALVSCRAANEDDQHLEEIESLLFSDGSPIESENKVREARGDKGSYGGSGGKYYQDTGYKSQKPSYGNGGDAYYEDNGRRSNVKEGGYKQGKGYSNQCEEGCNCDDCQSRGGRGSYQAKQPSYNSKGNNNGGGGGYGKGQDRDQCEDDQKYGGSGKGGYGGNGRGNGGGNEGGYGKKQGKNYW